MRLIKSLFALLLVVAILGGGAAAYGWFWLQGEVAKPGPATTATDFVIARGEGLAARRQTPGPTRLASGQAGRAGQGLRRRPHRPPQGHRRAHGRAGEVDPVDLLRSQLHVHEQQIVVRQCVPAGVQRPPELLYLGPHSAA